MTRLPARYEPCGPLGEGGMGRVLRVLDRERGHEVALKVLTASGDAEARWLFEREFWTMASARHPHLVEAHDFGTLPDGAPYFTMELIDGADVAATSEAEMLAWLPGLLSALGFLHGRGSLHADLKPGNVRLGTTGVKLMDLGLLERVGQAGRPIRGSLPYLAPEVIGQGALDGRTDLYALGCLLYHVLAGRPPFVADEPLVLLRAHLDQRPEPLRRHAPGVSERTEALVARLLAKDPAARPPTAAAVAAALGLEVAAERRGLLGSPVVGRAALQAELQTLVASAAPWQLHVGGPAGSGKTRLGAEARALAQLAGAVVCDVRGLGEDAAPYAAIAPCLRTLSAGDPRLAPVLARMLPELGTIAGIAPPLEGAAERARLHAAVAELALAHDRAVWIVDDADVLDEASRALLDHVQTTAAGRSWGWWRASRADAPVTLAPLEPAALHELVAALLGQATPPEHLVERIQAFLPAPQPGPVQDLLAHWLHTGALLPGADGWTCGPDEAFDLAHDPAFDTLPPEARAVARLAALLGAAPDTHLLAALADVPAPTFFTALERLAVAGILLCDGTTFRLTRPALATDWPAAEAAAIRTRAAEQLADGPASLERALAIARLHLAGLHPSAAVPWALQAGRQAIALWAPAAVEPLLAACADLPDLAAHDRRDLAALRVEVHRFHGRAAEALALLEAEVRADTAPVLVTRGVLQQLAGAYDAALASFADAALLAAEDAPSYVRARLAAGRAAFFAGHTPAALEHLAAARARATDAGLVAQLGPVTSLYGFLVASSEPTRREEGLALMHEAIALNDASGDVYDQAETYNNLGNVLFPAGRLAEAHAAFARYLELCQRMGSANEALFGYLNLAAVQLELGDLAGCLERAAQAGAMAERQGRKFPGAFALALEGLARVRLGEHAAGMAALERGAAVAEAIANKYLALHVRTYQAEAALLLGDMPACATALGAAEALAAETRNDELAARLARLAAARAWLVNEAGAVERLVMLADGAAAHGPSEHAHALRWLAAARLEAGDPAGRLLLAEARRLADDAGLQGLADELATLARRASSGAPLRVPPLAPLPAETLSAERLYHMADRLAEVAAQPDMHGVMALGLATLVELAGAERGFLVLYRDLEVTEVVSHGVADEDEVFSTTLAHEVYWRRAPLLVEDVQAHGALGTAASVQALALRAVLGVPLFDGEDVIGVMLADSSRVHAGFGPEVQALAMALARQVAALIGAARRADAHRREAAVGRATAAAARDVLAAQDAPAAWRALLGHALRAAGADRAVLLAGAELASRWSLAADGTFGHQGAEISRSLARWALDQRKPAHLLDTAGDEQFNTQQSVLALGLRSVTAVPAMHADEPLGVLYMDAQRLAEPSTEALAVLAALGELAGALLCR